MLRCRLAVGGASQRLVGAEMPVGTGFVGDVARKQRTTVVTRAREDPRFDPATDTAGDTGRDHGNGVPHGRPGGDRGAIQVTGKRTGDGVFDRATASCSRGSPPARRSPSQRPAAHGRQAGSRPGVAARDQPRDHRDAGRRSGTSIGGEPRRPGAAIRPRRDRALDKGHCDIRAIAGQEQVDPDDPGLQDLAVRAAWAAGRGASFSSPTAAPRLPTPNGPFSPSSARISNATGFPADSTSL